MSVKLRTMILGTSTRISRIRDVNIIMNGTAVERVNTFQYLGITIDANLKWNDQIDNIHFFFVVRCAIVWVL